MADKTALIVGASRGIGLGLVKELVGRGWSVIGTRRSASSDKGLEEFVGASGGKARLESVDIEDPASIDALAGRLKGQALDLVFVNAGISGSHAPMATTSRDEVAQVFMTNAVGPVHVAESFKDKVGDGGVIAVMTSGLGQVDRPDHIGHEHLGDVIAADLADRRMPAADPGIDEDQVEGLALQPPGQGVDGGRILDVDALQPHPARTFRRVGLKTLVAGRRAPGADDAPAPAGQFLDQSQADATRSADHQRRLVRHFEPLPET